MGHLCEEELYDVKECVGARDRELWVVFHLVAVGVDDLQEE